MNTPRPGDAGITLVEMLVALMIFALVGVASFTTLDTILKVRSRTDGRLEQVGRLDRALFVFGRDMMQADPLSVTLSEETLRATLPGPFPARRFLLQDEAFVRQSGAALADDPLSQPLVQDVRALRFEVLDVDRIWHDSWPVEGRMPQALGVRMMLTLDGGRTLGRTVGLTEVVPK